MLWLRRWQRPRRPRPLPWCWLKATNGGVRVGSGRAAWEGRRRCLLEELVLAPEAWESKCAGGRRMIGGVRGPTSKTGTQSTGTARTRQGPRAARQNRQLNLRLEVGAGVGVAVLRGRAMPFTGGGTGRHTHENIIGESADVAKQPAQHPGQRTISISGGGLPPTALPSISLAIVENTGPLAAKVNAWTNAQASAAGISPT